MSLICVTEFQLHESGNYYIATQQQEEFNPDTPCKYTAEVQNLVPDIINLSVENGTDIGLSILGVWALAFAYRLLFNFIKSSEREINHE